MKHNIQCFFFYRRLKKKVLLQPDEPFSFYYQAISLSSHPSHVDSMWLQRTLSWPQTHLISFEFLIFLVNEELVLGDLGLDGAEKRAALVCVHWFVLETEHNDCIQQ